LLSDHQADGCGPPAVRGAQVENRCAIGLGSRDVNYSAVQQGIF